MNTRLKYCDAHLADAEMVSNEIITTTCLTADGDFFMLQECTQKIRCARCGVVELVQLPFHQLAPIQRITWRGLFALLRRRLVAQAASLRARSVAHTERKQDARATRRRP